MTIWREMLDRLSGHRDPSVATRYSLTHTMGKSQRLTFHGAESSLTLEVDDEMAKSIAAGLTAGVIYNAKYRKKA